MLRVLLIDDNLDDRLLVVRQLNQEFEDIQIEQIIDQNSFDQALAANCFDIAITDYYLIWTTGLEVLKQLKAVCPDCPVIMFTNTATQENAVEAMKAGLDDYIVKSPRHYIRLASAVKLALQRTEDRRKATQLETRLQSLLNQLSVGVFRATLEGRLLEANAAFLQLLGLDSLEAAQAINLHDIFQPQVRSQILQQLQQEGQFLGREIQMCRADNTTLWVSLNKTVTCQGKDYFVEGLIEDIGDRKNLENALHEKAEELAEANRLKDEFLLTIYHELRSPLNSILGWSKLLRSQRAINSGILERALEAIERNAIAQTNTVEDILDVSKIIQGKLRLNVAPVNLSTVIHAAVEVMYPAAAAKNIVINISVDPTVGVVAGDANRLQQVIWNLVSNAIKFTPMSGQVEIGLRRKDCFAQITVTDTGIGISTEFLPYVFDRFRQADGSTSRNYSGMGLGLAIVRHLVELHGGTVSVESLGLDQGATFTVKIPLEVQSTTQQGRPLKPNPNWSEMTDLRILEGLKVLVVEDDADNRQLIEFMLSLCGAVVFAVPSARAAVEVMEALMPDVLISDIGMPDQDGYALMEHIRVLQQQPNQPIPAIALTAYSGSSAQQRAIAAGFQLHLTKPVTPEELVRAIVTLTGRDVMSSYTKDNRRSWVRTGLSER